MVFVKLFIQQYQYLLAPTGSVPRPLGARVRDLLELDQGEMELIYPIGFAFSPVTYWVIQRLQGFLPCGSK